jgi:trigger factor
MSAAATAPQNKVTITDAGPSRKKLKIEIPAAAVSERMKDAIDALAASATLPGFRRGHVPRRLIEKRFASSIRDETKQQLVSEAYKAAVEEHKIRVVGQPSSDQIGQVEVVEGKPLSIEIDVEVLPEFTMPKLEGVAIKKPTYEVTDAQVEDELKKICINEGSLESRDNPEAGDYLTGHAIMTGPKGEEFYNINGAVVQVPAKDKGGKGMILGIMVDDFSKQLGLPKAGETVTIKAKGPEQHEIEGVRNAALTMTFKVDRIDRIIPAELATIVAALGFTDEAGLRDAIRARLRQRAMVQQQVAMRQQLSKYLLDSTTIELPEKLTAHQSARTLERRRVELMYRGFEPHKIEEHIAELRAASSVEAQRELKLFFILNKAAEDFNVQVSEGEMNARLAQLAAERNVRIDKLRQEIVQRNQVGVLFQQIREHKVMDMILSKAAITDVSPEEYEKSLKA